MKQLISPEGAVLGLMVLIASAVPAAAQVASQTAATRPVACDTAGARAGLATVASYDRPFTSADPVGVRPRHAVLGPAGAPAGGAGARGRRVRKDVGGDRVGKDRRPVAARKARKDSAAWCPQLATTPGAGVGEVTGETPVLPNTGSAPGEVLPFPQLPGSVARRGTRFFLPPLLGGALLGGSAIALANRPRGGTAETPRGPVTPLVPVPPTTPAPPTPAPPPPTTPIVPAAPTPTPPTAPGGPVPPTAPPSSTTPTPGVPATPTTPITPLVPTTPDDPAVPTATVPEPATVVLLAAGLVGLGAAGRRRRQASR